MSDEVKKCAHITCTCTVSGDRKYCSQFCEDAAVNATDAIGCDCPHAGCGGKL